MNYPDSVLARAFERLVDHLDKNRQIQNIDLMTHGGFCRNCLSKWIHEASNDADVESSIDQAKEFVYKMPYETYKAKYQTKLSDKRKI